MLTKEILNSHPATTLKKEISKTNIKGYSKLKKGELVELMMKNKERFSHIKKKGEETKEEPKKKKKKKIFLLPKKEEPKKPAKKETKPKAKKLTMKEVEDSDAFDKSKYKDFYFDLVERFIDGKGSEEKQLDRAGSRAYSFIIRQTKKLAKKEKVISVKQLVDAINKISFNDFRDM